MLNVRNVLLLAKQKRVHTEETRGVGMGVSQNYTKKPEMPPITFVGILCKIFNFCPQSAQSRRHGGALVGLAPQTKLQAPKLERGTLQYISGAFVNF